MQPELTTLNRSTRLALLDLADDIEDGDAPCRPIGSVRLDATPEPRMELDDDMANLLAELHAESPHGKGDTSW